MPYDMEGKENHMKYMIMIAVLFHLFSFEAYANVQACSIEVKELVAEGDDEYKLVFRLAEKTGEFCRERMKNLDMDGYFVLHIRFKPRCVTDLRLSNDIYIKRKRNILRP